MSEKNVIIALMDDRIKLVCCIRRPLVPRRTRGGREIVEKAKKRKTRSTKRRGCYLAKQPEMGLITGGIKQPSGC